MTAASTSTFDPHKMLGSKTHRFCFRLPCFRYVFCSISVELLRRVTDWERPRKEESIAPGVTKRIEGQQSIAVCSFDSTVNGMFLSRRARTNHGEQGMEIPDSWGRTGQPPRLTPNFVSKLLHAVFEVQSLHTIDISEVIQDLYQKFTAIYSILIKSVQRISKANNCALNFYLQPLMLSLSPSTRSKG